MNRFLFDCKNNKEKLKQAVELQFSIDQPAIIYYGTELGLSQKKSIWAFTAHGDIQSRMPMNWDNSDKNLYDFYKKTIKKKNKK